MDQSSTRQPTRDHIFYQSRTTDPLHDAHNQHQGIRNQTAQKMARQESEQSFLAMKASLQHSTGRIARHEETASGTRPLSGAAVATLAEVALKYTEIMAGELRAFSR